VPHEKVSDCCFTSTITAGSKEQGIKEEEEEEEKEEEEQEKEEEKEEEEEEGEGLDERILLTSFLKKVIKIDV
jgi:ribosomal protein L12E/L44/L45/RPP1/RPP2